MSTEIARAGSARQSLLSKFGDRYSIEPAKLYETLCKTVFSAAQNQEQVIALLVVADQYGLNPLTKELYAFPDKNGGVVPVVGIDGWNRIAQQHPAFDGVEFRYAEKLVKPDGGKPCPEWVEVIVYRKDREHPIVAREYLDECYRKTGPWQSHTKRMLRHKALIQGYRMAFGFHGIYDPDEAERIAEEDRGEQTTRVDVSDRVLARIHPPAVTVDAETGEVEDADIVEEAAIQAQESAQRVETPEQVSTGQNGSGDAQAAFSEEDEADEFDLALGNVEQLRPERATAAQVKTIKALVKSTGMYEVELVGLLDSYHAQTIEGLSKKDAGFVVAALKEREARA